MKQNNTYLLTGGNVVTPQGVLNKAALGITKGIISAIYTEPDQHVFDKFSNVIELDNKQFVLPGFIDLHIHGSSNADVMNASHDSLATITHSLFNQGVTGFLATTMTESDSSISEALTAVAQYVPEDEQEANILGVHLEGPFISKKKVGAQSSQWLKKPEVEQFSAWQQKAGGLIKQVTLAPEEDEHFSLIRYLNDQGIIASIGHTACTASEANEAIKAGASHATHLFNAMTGVSHRDPGAATAILLNKAATAELIVDGVHLSPEIVQLALLLKGADKLILITDAMRAQGAGEGVFNLGSQKVYVKGSEARLKNGALAGSVLTMNKALKNMMQITHCSISEASKMASMNAATKLGLIDRGVIEVGKKADLTILDEDFQVKRTFTH